tara:strand:- start:760 stop:1149 length:390 start_codon:yes stop_codon:yes gene_type:complete
MAVHTGSAGVVKIASNTVAEVTAFTMETTADVIESTQLSDTNKTYEVSRKSGTVTVECMWDETDTNGQIVLQEATGVTLLLYPEGADSGDYFYTVPAIVTGNSVAVTMDDIIRLSISCQINGAITRGTV